MECFEDLLNVGDVNKNILFGVRRFRDGIKGVLWKHLFHSPFIVGKTVFD